MANFRDAQAMSQQCNITCARMTTRPIYYLLWVS
jgi:hypothetical protein